MRGWRAEKRKPTVSRSLRGPRGRLSARQLQRLFGTGPRFPLPAPPQMACRRSASSWRGLIVNPGGAPAPPECRLAKSTRGRRASSRLTTPHERAPQWTRWMQDNRDLERGDWGRIPRPGLVIPAKAGIQGQPARSKRLWIPAFAGMTEFVCSPDKQRGLALPRCRRLRLEQADVGDEAAPAFGLLRLAHIAPVQDQPVMAVVLVALGHDAFELELDLERRLAGCQPGAVGHPEGMGVDADGRLAEGGVEHDIGGLPPDAGQGHQNLAAVRHFAAMLGDELARQGNQVLCLVAKEPDGLDLLGERRLAESSEFLRRSGDAEQVGRDAVDGGVGRLRRQDHGYQQGEGVLVVELRLGVRGDLLKTAEDLVDLALRQARAGGALAPRLRSSSAFRSNHGPCLPLAKGFYLEHDLFGKPVPTFPDHALGLALRLL